MKEYLVVGDIAGNFDALMRLRNLCPGELICLGDLVDRGPDSRKVVEYIMNGGGRSVKGNHEDMMIDWCRKTKNYSKGVWFFNGGDTTVASWGGTIPNDVVDWLDALPLQIELEVGNELALASHAFTEWGSVQTDEQRMWSRGDCIENPKYKWQLTGHNSHFGLRYFGNPWYGVCLDTSRSETLTGMHLPTGKIYSVPLEELQ